MSVVCWSMEEGEGETRTFDLSRQIIIHCDECFAFLPAIDHYESVFHVATRLRALF